MLTPTDIASAKALADITADTLRRLGMNVDAPGDGLGNAGAASRQDGSGGAGRLEHLPHQLERARQINPAGHIFLRGNGKAAVAGLADQSEDRGTARCLVQGAGPRGAEVAGRADSQLQAFQDVPYIPLGQYFMPTAYQANLTGVLQGSPVFWNYQRS